MHRTCMSAFHSFSIPFYKVVASFVSPVQSVPFCEIVASYTPVHQKLHYKERFFMSTIPSSFLVSQSSNMCTRLSSFYIINITWFEIQCYATVMIHNLWYCWCMWFWYIHSFSKEYSYRICDMYRLAEVCISYIATLHPILCPV